MGAPEASTVDPSRRHVCVCVGGRLRQGACKRDQAVAGEAERSPLFIEVKGPERDKPPLRRDPMARVREGAQGACGFQPASHHVERIGAKATWPML